MTNEINSPISDNEVQEILEIIDRQTKGATTARTKIEPEIPPVHPDNRVDRPYYEDDGEEEYPR